MHGAHLAVAARAPAHLVAALMDLPDAAAHQDLHQALVSERPQFHVLYGRAATR